MRARQIRHQDPLQIVDHQEQLSEIERAPAMHALIRLVAARSGQLLVPGSLGGELALPRDTVARYLRLLEEVFLIKRIPAWSRNLSTRAVATPKVFVVDSGLASHLCNVDAPALRAVGSPLGSLLEGFVASEVARQLTWSNQDIQMFHYRTRDNIEVDLILENAGRKAIAIEVKASSTVRGEDFRGLRHVSDRLGDDLLAGYVLYLGTETLPFGPKLCHLPG